MKTLLDVPAPAKLNLFLHVVGRRPDGYHLIQSVFVLLDLCDRLGFQCNTSGRLSREDCGATAIEAPLPADDLVIKAAKLLQQATGCRLGAHIQLEKRIPMQAGLGGGSSDAATCLMALNRLWNTGLSRPQLTELGLKLGADVPFFLLGHNAWVEGVGEQLTPIHLPITRFVLVKPPTGVATESIFSDPMLKRDSKPATMQGFADYSVTKKLAFGKNDLQVVAEAQCSDVKTCLSWLTAKHLSGRMTGSGSAVFAPLNADVDLSDAPCDWHVFRCNSLEQHPLTGWMT